MCIWYMMCAYIPQMLLASCYSFFFSPTMKLARVQKLRFPSPKRFNLECSNSSYIMWQQKLLLQFMISCVTCLESRDFVGNHVGLILQLESLWSQEFNCECSRPDFPLNLKKDLNPCAIEITALYIFEVTIIHPEKKDKIISI